MNQAQLSYKERHQQRIVSAQKIKLAVINPRYDKPY